MIFFLCYLVSYFLTTKLFLVLVLYLYVFPLTIMFQCALATKEQFSICSILDEKWKYCQTKEKCFVCSLSQVLKMHQHRIETYSERVCVLKKEFFFWKELRVKINLNFNSFFLIHPVLTVNLLTTFSCLLSLLHLIQ